MARSRPCACAGCAGWCRSAECQSGDLVGQELAEPDRSGLLGVQVARAAERRRGCPHPDPTCGRVELRDLIAETECGRKAHREVHVAVAALRDWTGQWQRVAHTALAEAAQQVAEQF